MSKREIGGVVHTPGGPGVPAGNTRRDPHNPTRLGGDPREPPGPFIDPGISDPRALAYAQGAASRRRGMPIPRYTDAVAGGPDVPIPRLDAEATGGFTMAEQALRQRGLPQPSFDPRGAGEPALGNRQPAPAPSIVEGDEHLRQQAQPPQNSTRANGLTLPPGIMASDVLPDQATKDPMFTPGQGSMMAANQVHLALKYGVMRNGQFIPPTQLRGMAPGARQVGGAPAGASTIRPETVEGLKALESFNAQRDKTEGGDEAVRIKAEAQSGPAGGVGSTEPKLSDEAKKELLNELDEFDLSRLKNAVFKDLLNNDDQRKIIEGRLKELNLVDLIVEGRVSQVVPVVPGTFEPEFQSYGGDEDLCIKRLIGEEAEQLKPSERYLLDKYTLMGLTVSIRGINKRLLPDYRDKEGNFDEQAFWRKYALVSKFNYHMLGSLAVNWYWFDMRVRHLFKADTLGNG